MSGVTSESHGHCPLHFNTQSAFIKSKETVTRYFETHHLLIFLLKVFIRKFSSVFKVSSESRKVENLPESSY